MNIKKGNKVTKASRITLEDLAIMVQGGFLEMQEQFQGVNGRLDNLEVGQKILQQDMEFVKLRLDSKADRFEVKVLETRVERLEHV